MQAEPGAATAVHPVDAPAAGGAWYTSVAPGAHRLLRGRHYRRIALDGERVTVTTKRGVVMFDASLHELELVRVRNGLLLQVLARDPTSRIHVFEFRPRRHAAGRALADALR
jgi:hypothetical protein